MDDTRIENPSDLTPEEEQALLRIARRALQGAVKHGEPDQAILEREDLPPRLLAHGASFVTLRVQGDLRGCIGSVCAFRPLALDVAHNTVAAALHDPRFWPISVGELAYVEIELSILTPPQRLDYTHAADLVARFRPGIDGVILVHGHNRAVLLPQVWEILPEPTKFMEALCMKAGLPPKAYLDRNLEIYTFQVHKIVDAKPEPA